LAHGYRNTVGVRLPSDPGGFLSDFLIVHIGPIFAQSGNLYSDGHRERIGFLEQIHSHYFTNDSPLEDS
jgi:hypothetical protein